MKFKTTQREIKNNYTVVSFGFCELQSLLNMSNPIAYTCGVYGWNSDIYELEYNGGSRRFAISTGYRPFSNIDVKGKHELAEKYEKRARELRDEYRNWDEYTLALKGLVADFAGDLGKAISEALGY